MLVLSREIDEAIVIEPPGCDPIAVYLVAIKGPKKARIGIEAAPHIPVHRMEVWQAIQEAKGCES